MSVEELKFPFSGGAILEIKFKDNEVKFMLNDLEDYLVLDISEAHLLMLYLQEHLK